jgi:hypothetical protein
MLSGHGLFCFRPSGDANCPKSGGVAPNARELQVGALHELWLGFGFFSGINLQLLPDQKLKVEM